MRNDSRLHYREFYEGPFSGRIPPHLAVERVTRRYVLGLIVAHD